MFLWVVTQAWFLPALSRCWCGPGVASQLGWAPAAAFQARGGSQSTEPKTCGTFLPRTGSSCPSPELVASEGQNSCHCRPGNEEVAGRHACRGSATAAPRRAARGISAAAPLTSGSRRCDSCRGGAEGHRPVYGGGCFCRWERGRKRRPMPPRGVRARPRPPRFQEASGQRRLPRVPQQRRTRAHPAPRAETPAAVSPEGSVAVQVPQQGEVFRGAGLALAITIPRKRRLPQTWLSAAASRRQGHSSRRRAASPSEGRDRDETAAW